MRRTSDGPVWEPRDAAWRSGGSDAPGFPHASHRRRHMCAGSLRSDRRRSAQVPHRSAGDRSPGLLDARGQVLDDVEGLAVLADAGGRSCSRRTSPWSGRGRRTWRRSWAATGRSARGTGTWRCGGGRTIDLRALVAAQVGQAHAVGPRRPRLLDLLDRDRRRRRRGSRSCRTSSATSTEIGRPVSEA